jgi:hypothetical protein
MQASLVQRLLRWMETLIAYGVVKIFDAIKARATDSSILNKNAVVGRQIYAWTEKQLLGWCDRTARNPSARVAFGVSNMVIDFFEDHE